MLRYKQIYLLDAGEMRFSLLYALQNPKDPVVVRQRAIMMPAEEKRFVRAQHCFLMRNMIGQPPQIVVPKKPNGVQPHKLLLPHKTDGKIESSGERFMYYDIRISELTIQD